MPKCQVCNNDNMTFTEIWKGKTMCLDCEKNGRKVPITSKIKGAFVLFILFFGVYQCGKCSKTDTPKVERIEQDNGQVQYKVREELVRVREEKEVTLSQIPNVVSYDIYAPFVEMGFNDLGKDFHVGSCFWTYDLVTENGTFYLRIFGENPNKIQQIDASLTLIESDTKGVKAYFIAVAKTVYKGSDFDEASSFINKNVNRNTETRIGGIRLRLIKNGRCNTLTIGVNDEF